MSMCEQILIEYEHKTGMKPTEAMWKMNLDELLDLFEPPYDY